MRPNRIKQMWREGKCVTMGWLSISNGFTAEVMARQGFDALVIDMQHGLTDMANLWPMLKAVADRHRAGGAGGRERSRRDHEGARPRGLRHPGAADQHRGGRGE